MGKLVLVVCFLLSLSSNLEAKKKKKLKECHHSNLAFRCVEYVRNYDGDTVTFDIPEIHPVFGSAINVRVRGIDTAEINSGEPCEKDAAIKARTLVAETMESAARIDLLGPERGKYFRIVAEIAYDGKPLSRLLLNNNLAYIYEGGTKPRVDWCDMLKRPPPQTEATP